MADQRFHAAALIKFAVDLLAKAGLPSDRAAVVAEALVEGDLLGRTTHGLQLLPLYLDAIAKGAIQTEGEPTIVSDRGAAITWDGNWLPGPWLMRKAMDVAFERVSDHPVVTFVIRSAGHIGCLAVYPRVAAERDMMMILSCSDPSIASVAPHGAVEARFTPNPIAAGWPTENEPLVLDVCPSTTTNGMVARTSRIGGRLLGRWLIDRSGNATDDPGVLNAKPAGAIMPLGGVEQYERRQHDPGYLSWLIAREGHVLYTTGAVPQRSSPPGDRVREEHEGEGLADWIRRAESDIKVAELALAAAEPSWDAICFHSHACVEKLLKALIVTQGVFPPRTHELPELLALQSPEIRDAAPLYAACNLLTKLYPKSRYPEAGYPTPDEARSAIVAAREARRVLGAKLERWNASHT